jgi:D-alanyl-D-alanine carboxypeptidase/D-alanyl-D-alanine-endopeptidase (penicillin-binding protein 4)
VAVYGERAGQTVLPASNEKIVTASVALDELGAQYTFSTRLVGPAPVTGTISGDVHLVGGGDPNLSTQAYLARGQVNQQEVPAHPTSFETLADELHAAGVTAITGRVLGDDTRYDSQRYVATWPSDYRTTHQAGPLGALMVDDDYTSFDAPFRTADDPAGRAAAVLTQLLRQRGITVGGEAGSGAAPAGATDLVAPLVSAPLGAIVADLLTNSDNNTGELLLKEIGLHASQQGTTAAGGAEVLAALGRFGLGTDGLAVVDGSGLDRGNRMTCAVLLTLLDRAPTDGPLVQGLAVAGQTGTLATLFRGSPLAGKLRGKTGTLVQGGARALSGVVLLDGGHRIDYSFVFNGANPSDRAAPLIDDMVRAFSTYPAQPRLDDFGPRPVAG